jgi:septal ring factor EnvC (AmiA/AmiB activator)
MRGRIIICFLFIIGSAYAAPEHASLKQLNQKIASIQATLSVEQNKRNNYLQSLKSTEIAAGQALLKLQQTSVTLRKQQIVLQQLNKNADIYRTKLAAQQNALAKQMRSAYLLGRQPTLKLALNQADANRLSRLLMYYRYISQNRIATIQNLQLTLDELQQTQRETKDQTVVLANLQTKQQAERSKLEQLKQNRQFVVTQLNNEISNKQQKLSDLLANKKLLEQTIDRLDKAASMRTSPHGNFATLKGQLNLPTQGKILPYFGTKIYQSELRWDGILIQATEDQPIYAVADGQVVFAKWLPGYGLLLIISHGHGYMTLYGRNHNLYKKLGDMVQAGDLIATVGNSGGYDNPALYFAIRHNAIPLNPLEWCRRKA